MRVEDPKNLIGQEMERCRKLYTPSTPSKVKSLAYCGKVLAVATVIAWALVLLVSCMADYSGKATQKGIYECRSPIADRVFYLDTDAPDTEIMAAWPLATGHLAELRFTDLKTGERITLKQDSLNYKCEHVGEMPKAEKEEAEEREPFNPYF